MPLRLPLRQLSIFAVLAVAITAIALTQVESNRLQGQVSSCAGQPDGITCNPEGNTSCSSGAAACNAGACSCLPDVPSEFDPDCPLGFSPGSLQCKCTAEDDISVPHPNGTSECPGSGNFCVGSFCMAPMVPSCIGTNDANSFCANDDNCCGDLICNGVTGACYYPVNTDGNCLGEGESTQGTEAPCCDPLVASADTGRCESIDGGGAAAAGGGGAAGGGDPCNGADCVTGSECCDGFMCSAEVCVAATPCGDGTVDKGAGEECDDRNTTDGDGCDRNCQIKGGICGDGTKDDGEECDNGFKNAAPGSNALNDSCSPDRCCKDSCFFCVNVADKCISSGGSWIGTDNCNTDGGSFCECPAGSDIQDGKCVIVQCPEGLGDSPKRSSVSVGCSAMCKEMFNGQEAIERCTTDCMCNCGAGDEVGDTSATGSCYQACLDGTDERGQNGDPTCRTPDCCRAACVEDVCPADDTDDCGNFCNGAPPQPNCFPAPTCAPGGINGCTGTISFVNDQCQCQTTTFDICGGGGGNGGNGGSGGNGGNGGNNNGSSVSSSVSSSNNSTSSVGSSVSSSSNNSAVSGASSNTSSNVSLASGASSNSSSTVSLASGASSDSSSVISLASGASSNSIASSQFSSVSLLCGNGVVDAGEDCDNGKVCDVNPTLPCSTVDDCRKCGLINGQGRCAGSPNGAVCINSADCANESFACIFDTEADPTCGSNCRFIGASSVSSTVSIASFSSFDVAFSAFSSENLQPAPPTPPVDEDDDGDGDNDDGQPNNQDDDDNGDGDNDDGIPNNNDPNARCGNFRLEGSEQCDDGNLLDGDTCTSRCTTPRCGDGIVSINEQCDDGNTIGDDGCTASCIAENGDGGQIFITCGNSVIEAGEECDDGNREDGDTCTPTCQNPVCGDGFLAPFEQCDDGNAFNRDGCDSQCRTEEDLIAFGICGDNSVQGSEQCDDGNTIGGDGCSATCRLELGDEDDGDGDNDDGIQDNDDGNASVRCGDGVREFPEQCDDGNTRNGDGCNGACKLELSLSLFVEESSSSKQTIVAAASVCGDGVLAGAEECDDNNRRDNDGCSSGCELEVGICGDGVVQSLLGEQCEQVSHDKSLPYSCVQCRFVSDSCGDGVVDPGEECDDGSGNSASPDATCRPTCQFGRCGDGIQDTSEECDDGNRLNGDGCNRQCGTEEDTRTTVVASEVTDIPFNTQPPAPVNSWQYNGFPMQANMQQIPYQLPLAQLQPLIQNQAPVGDTGPAAVAVIGAGAAAGWSWMRRKK